MSLAKILILFSLTLSRPKKKDIIGHTHLEDVDIIELPEPWEVEFILEADLANVILPEEHR